MAYQTTSTPFSPLIWPENLDDIKITKQEKQELENKIHTLRKMLPPKTTTNDPSIIEFTKSSPRQLYVGHDHCLVVLNCHGGMPLFPLSGSQQKKIKYVWDCQSGSFYLKKTYKSEKQTECLNYLKYGHDVGKSSLGIPHIVTDPDYPKLKGKFRYFEKKGDLCLPEWLKQYKGEIHLVHIIGLMDALRKIHSVHYQPSLFGSLPSPCTTFFSFGSPPHQLFHGDISPRNIICTGVKDESTGKTVPQLQLTDFYGFADVNHLVGTKGWKSPEYIKFRKKTEGYQTMSTVEFSVKYGAKKDTWAMGLLIGSLLRGGMHPSFKQSLPPFSFITKRLKFDQTSQHIVDDSELADITQEEIDTKIDKLIEKEPSETLKTLWSYVKQYLTVDPDKRPTMAECYPILRES